MNGSSRASASAEARFKSPLRQNGFSIASSSTDSLGNPNQHYLSRSRTSTGSTVTLREHAVGMSANGNHHLKPEAAGGGVGDDGDVEMMDEPSSSIRPLPIPRTYEPRSIGGTTASHTPSDVATPPDGVLRRPSITKTPAPSTSASSAIRLPSVSPSFRGSPRVGSHTGNTNWSPPNTEPHIYNGGGSYPYSTVKPYLSTSFQTSAERSGGSAMDDDDDIDEDVFGHTASQLGLQDSPAYTRGRSARGTTATTMMEEMDGEGDAAGVFSFSSPYLRPQSVDDSSVPALPPSPPEAHKATSGAPADRVLSPSITARSLQQLSLGGGVEMSNSPSQGSSSGGIGASRRRPSHMHHHAHSYTNGAPSAFSRSLPSGGPGLNQARRLSSGRLGRPIMPPSSVSAYSIASSNGAGPSGSASAGIATLFSRSPSGNSPYGRSPAGGGSGIAFARPSPYGTPSSGRVPSAFAVEMPSRHERSRSRQRWGVPRAPEPAAVFADEEVGDEEEEEGDEDDEDEDDDATDDEMVMTTSTATLTSGGTIRQGRSIVRRPIATSTSATLDSTPATPLPATTSSSTADDNGTDETAAVTLIRDRLGGAANCAAFIAKLWYLLTHPHRYSKYIHWNATGTTVILSTDTEICEEFAAEVLPRLWNHANYSSFIRQMNLYGFMRLPSSRILEKDEVMAAKEEGLAGVKEDGGSGVAVTAQQVYGSHSSFLHPKFARGREDLLPLLKPRNAKKPKAGGKKGEEDGGEE